MFNFGVNLSSILTFYMDRHGAHRRLTSRKGTRCGCKGSNTSKQTVLTWTASHCGFISWGNRWRRRDWWVLTEIRNFCLLKPLRLIKVMSVWCSVYILMIEVITGNTRTQEFDMNWKNRHVEVFSYSCSFKLCLQLIINMHEDSVYM